MTIYLYEQENATVQNGKYPATNHLFNEINSKLYFADASDDKVLLKTSDEGTTVDTVVTYTDSIIATYPDFTNDYLYVLNQENSLVSKISRIDTSDDSVSVHDDDRLWCWDILYDGSDVYYFVTYQDTSPGPNQYDIYTWIFKIITWGDVGSDEATSQFTMGNGSGVTFEAGHVIKIGSDFWYLYKLSTENVKLWKATYATGAGTNTEMADLGANTDFPDNTNLISMSYDGSNIIYFIIKDTSDNKNYLYSYAIDTDTTTKKGEYNVSLMLERNTDSSNAIPFNLEKGIDISSRYIYQIARSKANLYKIADLTNAVADGTLVGITDTYLFLKRSSNDIELWKFQNASNYIIEALIYHPERSYPTAELTYRADKLFLEDGMFLQMIGNVRVNGSTSVGVRFEGYVIAPADEDDESIYIKTVDLINPIYYDLKNSYAGTLSAGSGDDWLDTIDDDFDYGTKGTYDAGTLSLPETVRNSGKDNQQFIDQLALGEGFTWRFRPTGELDWTNGADDSGLNYDQSTPIYDVEVTKKKIRPNAITVKGGYVNGSQVSSDTDHGQDLPDQQQYGKIPIEVNIAWISTTSLCNSYADAILALVNQEYIEVIFSVRDTTNGFVPPGEEITLADSNKGITSAQYKINNVVFDDKTSIATYTVSSVVRWDEDDLLFGFEQELSDQVDQLGGSIADNKSNVEAYLAIGSANARWKSLSLHSADVATSMTTRTYFSNTGANDFYMLYNIDLPPKLGTLDLYISELQILIHTSDATDYVTRIRFFVYTDEDSGSTPVDLDHDTLNGTAKGTYTYDSGDDGDLPYNCGSGVFMGILVDIIATTQDEVKLTGFRVKYYYA